MARRPGATATRVTAVAQPPTAPPWRSRIVDHGDVDPRSLTPHPLNPRRHPATQLAALGGILDELGWLQDVIVNRTTGHMLDGHARVEQAIATEQETVPVKYVELTEEEELLALATFDPIGNLARVDEPAMAALIEAAQASPPTNAAAAEFVATLAAEVAPSPGGTENAEMAGPQYLVLITCGDEAHQQALQTRLLADGLTCRTVGVDKYAPGHVVNE